jgi:hypothetical protein
MTQSMLLTSTQWNEQETFKIIPISQDAPYVEVIYDKQSKVMVVISKQTKTALHMLPKLDENGYSTQIKSGQHAGKQKQERKQIEVFYEYYIENQTDMENIIKNLVVNQEFNWKQYLEETAEK